MATIPVTVPDADVVRVQEAVGVFLGLRNGSGQQRNATTAEVQGYIATQLKNAVRGYEEGKAVTTAAAAVQTVNIT